jgi:hypothetical protein
MVTICCLSCLAPLALPDAHCLVAAAAGKGITCAVTRKANVLLVDAFDQVAFA